MASFTEALGAMERGERWRRPSFDRGKSIGLLHYTHDVVFRGDDGDTIKLDARDILADDWEPYVEDAEPFIGRTFAEALELMKAGRPQRRRDWIMGLSMRYVAPAPDQSGMGGALCFGLADRAPSQYAIGAPCLSFLDVLATDWEDPGA